MSVRRVMGTETEYGISVPGQPGANAMVTSSDAGRCTIISNDKTSMITINIEAEGNKTKIQITNVTKSGASSSSN